MSLHDHIDMSSMIALKNTKTGIVHLQSIQSAVPKDVKAKLMEGFEEVSVDEFSAQEKASELRVRKQQLARESEPNAIFSSLISRASSDLSMINIPSDELRESAATVANDGKGNDGAMDRLKKMLKKNISTVSP